MEPISIRRAWSTGTARVREQWREVVAIAVAAVILPSLLNYLVLGSALEASLSATDGLSGPLGVAGIVVTSMAGAVLSGAGYMMAWRRLAQQGEGWGATIAYGVLAALAIGLLGMVVAGGFAMLFGLGIAGLFAGAAMGDSPPTFLFVLIPLILVGMVWLFGRLIVTGPAMADVPTYNLFRGLASSWRLTRVSQWKVAGFVVVISILSGIVSAMAGGAALLSGTSLQQIAQPSLGVILTSLIVQIPVFMLWVAVAEGLYREALGTPDIAEVFA